MTIRIADFNLGTKREADSQRKDNEGNKVEILPATRGRAERDFLNQVIIRRRRACQGQHPENQKRNENGKMDETDFHEASSDRLRDLVLPETPAVSPAAMLARRIIP